jgi:hypothetical protein
MAQVEQKRLSYDYYWRKQKRKAVTELPKLATQANTAYRKAEKCYGRMLDYAKECGEALCAARKYFKARSPKWKRWLKGNFRGSYESAKIYMRISRKWPIVEEAKAKGFTATSIATVLKLLRYQKLAEQEGKKEPVDLSAGMTEKEKWESQWRQCIRRQFADEVKRLRRDELEILQEGFFHYFWPKWYRELRKVVARVTETPYEKPEVDANGVPYGDSWEELEEIKRVARRKLSKSRRSNKKP